MDGSETSSNHTSHLEIMSTFSKSNNASPLNMQPIRTLNRKRRTMSAYVSQNNHDSQISGNFEYAAS